MGVFIVVKSVNMNLKVSIFPDDDMIQVLEQNIGNNRFVWNNVLSRYNDLYKLFKSHGYPLNPNITTLNTILNMLKKENSFLREGESTSQQQTCRDLNKAFTRFFKNKSAYPRFKSRKSDKKSFRIAKNGNNIKISNRRIKLPKIGHIHYRTSKKYKKLLKTSKIYSTTIKRENGKYYAIINIKTTINKLKKNKKKQ